VADEYGLLIVAVVPHFNDLRVFVVRVLGLHHLVDFVNALLGGRVRDAVTDSYIEEELFIQRVVIGRELQGQA
jgi:hypothetical protein